MKFGPRTNSSRLRLGGRGRPGLAASSAFTLAEVLAALLFMAIVVPVALEAMHIASRAGGVAQRKSEAAQMAVRLLNDAIVTTNWNQGVQGGTEAAGLRQFRWTLRNDPWTQDPYQTMMRQLTIEVAFTTQGRDYSIRMSTLVDSSVLTNMP
ncbi:MAG: hypothetical protein KGS61_12995 [Verrucomicrobia bacterium]|nr:hypothetical protein [Verrucomicrobiota bacterium]